MNLLDTGGISEVKEGSPMEDWSDRRVGVSGSDSRRPFDRDAPNGPIQCCVNALLMLCGSVELSDL